MSSVSYPLRIKKPIMELAELRAREENTDKTTAIKQLLYTGAEEYAMKLYEQGRISLSLTAKLLDKNVHEILYLAEKYGIKTGGTLEQQEISEKNAKKLKLKK
ncbi:MAG: hypothetical protein HYW50_00745 [Candidatus Diapherotrites archaeon]|nr:hypothetical protein [Candidatus Diapherotrites archaeon]